MRPFRLLIVALLTAPAWCFGQAKQPAVSPIDQPAVSPVEKPALKPPCRGLMTRDVPPPQGFPFLDSVVVQVNWKDLEAADQDFTGSGWDKIEKARKSGLKIRLRVFAGVHAPNFVKKLGGPPISDAEHQIDCSKTGGIALWNPHDKKGGSVPYWWAPEVLDQYEQLMREVARRYEDAPDICEIVDSGAMTLYAEPFYRAHTDTATNTRLFQAGLTFEKDKAAHERCIRIHEALFEKTRTSLAINAWDVIDDSPSHRHSSFEPTYDFAQWAKQLMGERLVLQNNGCGPDSGFGPDATPRESLFCYLAHVDGPKGFQTRTLARLGGDEAGLYKTLSGALKMGANFIEMPSGFAKFDKQKLKEWDEKFENTPLTKEK